jgi:hypothetical protein
MAVSEGLAAINSEAARCCPGAGRAHLDEGLVMTATRIPHIGVILGSTREGRFGEKPANWIHGIADKRPDLSVVSGGPKKSITLLKRPDVSESKTHQK